MKRIGGVKYVCILMGVCMIGLVACLNPSNWVKQGAQPEAWGPLELNGLTCLGELSTVRCSLSTTSYNFFNQQGDALPATLKIHLSS